MQELKSRIVGVFIGEPKPLGKRQVRTSIVKEAVNGSLDIKKDYLPGDSVSDVKYHGGPDRVIHQYSLKQYEYLKLVFPEDASKFVAGSYGENITSEEFGEKDLCLGDIFKLGTAKVQLSEPRKPCKKIDLRYEADVLKEIISSGRYGWFYRVLEEGEVKVGDFIELVERPFPELNLDRVIDLVYKKKDMSHQFVQAVFNSGVASVRLCKYIDLSLAKD